MKKIFQKLAMPAAVIGLIAAVLEAGSLPGPFGEKSQRLEHYKQGNIFVPTPGYEEGLTDQCLVEKPKSQITYTFHKATAVLTTQLLFSGKNRFEGMVIGSLPDFKTVPLPCNQITNIPGRKWDNFEVYKQDIQDELKPIKQKLKELANEPDTSRFSVLKLKVEPRRP